MNMKPCDQNPTLPLESNKTHQQSIYNHHIERERSSSYDRQESEEKTQQCNNGLAAGDHHQEMNIKEDQAAATTRTLMQQECDCGRERLKRHRIEVAGRVWIPDIWGQEELLKDLIDCSAFDASLMPNRILSARQALVEEGRRATSFFLIDQVINCSHSAASIAASPIY